jgi:hypothetical protein
MIPVTHGRPTNELVPLTKLWRSKSKPRNLVGTLQDGFWLYIVPHTPEDANLFTLPSGEEHYQLLVGVGGDRAVSLGRLSGSEERIQGRFGLTSLTVLKAPSDPWRPGKDEWQVYVSIRPWRLPLGQSPGTQRAPEPPDLGIEEAFEL